MDQRYRKAIGRGLSATRSRRQVLGAATMSAIGGLGASLVGGRSARRTAAQTPPSSPVAGDVLVRRNILDLDPEGPEIKSLRKAVAEMKKRDASHPTSWIYQANMHGTVDRPLLPGWNSCQHGSWFFLPWHRLYLYWFEQILRDAAEDPTLTLPYWDYSAILDQELPEVFRLPADPSNSLFEPERDIYLNDGGHFNTVQAQALDHEWWFPFTPNFSHAPGDPPIAPGFIGPSFGGARVENPTSADPEDGPVNWMGPGQLENAPHGPVHTVVGGRFRDESLLPPFRPGYMGTFLTAGRDPLFWLHHANIDRLWNRWVELESSQGNPTEDVWLEQEFSFFDVNGAAVSRRVDQVLNNALDLGYRYDDDPLPGAGPAVVSVATPAAAFADERASVVAGVSASGLDVGPADLVVPIDIAEPASFADALAATPSAGKPDTRVIVTLAGIRGGGVPGVNFEVYLNQPENEEPAYDSAHFVGIVSLFGLLPQDMGPDAHAHSVHTLSFDITRNIDALKASWEWQDDIEVTLVARDLVATSQDDASTPAALSMATPETLPGPWATVESITVSYR